MKLPYNLLDVIQSNQRGNKMNDTTQTVRKHASLKDRIKISEFLKGVLVKDPGSDYWNYTGGMTDETVAQSMSKVADMTLTKNIVAGVRKEMYGNLQPRSSDTSALESTIKELQAVVTRQAEEIQKLLVRLGAVELAIKNNKRY